MAHPPRSSKTHSATKPRARGKSRKGTPRIPRKKRLPDKRGRRPARRRHALSLRLFLTVTILGLVGTAAFFVTLFYYTIQMNETIASRRWDLPSRLFPSPLDLRPGRRLPPGSLHDILQAMGYRKARRVIEPGQYREADVGHFYIYPRDAWKGLPDVRDDRIELTIRNHRVKRLKVYRGASLRKVIIPPVGFADIRAPDQAVRRVVPFDAFPEDLIHAVVAIEDRRFYEHRGLDPRALARAFYVNILKGNRAQGGSTLTQQLAKNYFLSPEKTFARKFRELFYALALEHRFTKTEILEFYLNEIYLGQRGSMAICGMGQAAYTFFSRDVEDLTLEESATLAGLIQAPNAYAPDRHPDRALRRRNIVLDAMLEQGYIDRETHDRAVARPITLRPAPYLSRTAGYFVDYVAEQLDDVIPSTDLRAEGYAIETTLDLRIQRVVESALERGLAKAEKIARVPLEGAVVVLQPQSGKILAMAGGRDYGKSQFNRAVRAKRQLGSVIKPLVFLAAIEKERPSLDPTTILLDAPFSVKVDGKVWSPKNYEREYFGDVSLRQVLEQSLNVPTVRLAMDIGIDRIAGLLEAVGLGSIADPKPSLALGALDVSPLDVASAFTAIATRGVMHPAFGVETVWNREGMIVYRARDASRRVADENSVFMIRDMMRGVLERGTARSARRLGYAFEAAGKTGTTNESRDAWFVGFDPQLLCVVWVGADSGAPTGLTGSRAALPIWVDIMKRVRGRDAPPGDPIPSGLVRARVCTQSLKPAVKACPNTIEELFWADHIPPDACPLHSKPFDDLTSRLKRLPDFFRRLFHGVED